MSSRPTTDAYLGELVSFRRDLHAHPELMYAECRTADRITAWLHALGLEIDRGLGRTGVVATLRGTGSRTPEAGPAIALRADMDALPMQELNTFDHASTVPKRMHACGHDGHVAMLLGGATLLSRQPDFAGTVHFVFQPAEEGGAGARQMIDDGLFRRFPVEAIFALHNWPAMPSGQMGVRAGPIMASANRFEIQVIGSGGHAAQPHTTIDPVPIACAIVGELQKLVSRTLDPLDSAVITVGRIDAGTAANIIPDVASIHGTCRALRPETQQRLVSGIERIATLLCQAHGASASVAMSSGYPATVNHAREARFMAGVMKQVAGESKVADDVMPALTAEDFGFMLQQVPGAYGFIGNGRHGRPGVSLHSPNYDFDDETIGLGSRFWDRLARSWFASPAHGTAAPFRS